jgi:putative PIG3 family NAD(P)H quinone oxidoreductase
VLKIEERPDPKPSEKEILIRVRAAGLNRADLLQRQGKYPAPAGYPADIPGMEFAGEVAALGQNARRWNLGQRVFGITGGGAQAELITAHEDTVAEVPSNLSWEEAGAIPEAFVTAHDATWVQAALKTGETIIIHAVGSGVGLAAVQLARAKGAIPFGTSRTQDKLDAAKAFGLERGLLLQEDFSVLKDFAKEVTNGKGFNVSLDLVGGAYPGGTVPAMALHGRIIMLATVGGNKAEIPLGLTLGKRLTLKGTVLRARPLEEKIAVTQRFAEEVVPLLTSGKLRVPIEKVFPLAEIGKAHELLESNKTFGKLVLRLD